VLIRGWLSGYCQLLWLSADGYFSANVTISSSVGELIFVCLDATGYGFQSAKGRSKLGHYFNNVLYKIFYYYCINAIIFGKKGIMANDTVVLFTAKSVERILEEGGTSSWRLDRNHARQCGYAVCTRNSNADWVEGMEEHHSAFLIGKILEVVPCPPTPENNESPEKRYLIQFSKFARMKLPNIWKGDRNPVKYTSLESLGINPSSLKWEKMPEPISKPERKTGRSGKPGIQPLTMAEAKKGLALMFNVAPEAIEIIVRG